MAQIIKCSNCGKILEKDVLHPYAPFCSYECEWATRDIASLKTKLRKCDRCEKIFEDDQFDIEIK